MRLKKATVATLAGVMAVSAVPSFASTGNSKSASKNSTGKDYNKINKAIAETMHDGAADVHSDINTNAVINSISNVVALKEQADKAAQDEAAKKAAEAQAAQQAAANASSSSSSASSAGLSAADAAKLAYRGSVVNIALQYVGKPYIMGGSSLATGTDCANFVRLVYQQYGKNIGGGGCQGLIRSSCMVHVDESAIQPGDLVFYGSPVHHVAIYIGNGQVVHEINSRLGCRVTSIGYCGSNRTIMHVN